jgi:hypothetical protein
VLGPPLAQIPAAAAEKTEAEREHSCNFVPSEPLESVQVLELETPFASLKSEDSALEVAAAAWEAGRRSPLGDWLPGKDKMPPCFLSVSRCFARLLHLEQLLLLLRPNQAPADWQSSSPSARSCPAARDW